MQVSSNSIQSKDWPDEFILLLTVKNLNTL